MAKQVYNIQAIMYYLYGESLLILISEVCYYNSADGKEFCL